ncbi:hypothetical protein GA0115246_1038510 [Streptomyces sp. SolWspMP-sol7th]|nr:hypothetical protein GA0115246_1038510 [Streptomyces sp. SolWspMP-sol7th]
MPVQPPSHSSDMRGTSEESPACGPVPVTRVPTAMRSAVTTTRTHARRTTLGPASGRGAASPSRLRCHMSAATAMSAEESRKCAATVYGLRPTSTTMPPSTALPMTSQNCVQPSRVSERRRGFAARAAMIAQPTAAHSTYVSIRLPNSMTPWNPISRVVVSEVSVHCGQVGQPSPDPVSRTAPPVTTMTTVIIRASSAARSTVRRRGV